MLLEIGGITPIVKEIGNSIGKPPEESLKIETKRLRASGYRETVFKPTQSGRSKRSSAKELPYD